MTFGGLNNNLLFCAENYSIDSTIALIKNASIDIKGKVLSHAHLIVLQNNLTDQDKAKLIQVVHSVFPELPVDYCDVYSIRLKAIRLLTSLQDSTASDILLSAYRDSKKISESDSCSEDCKFYITGARVQSLLGLAKIDDPRAESLAMECIHDTNSVIVDAAISVFGNMGSEKSVPLLLGLLRKVIVANYNYKTPHISLRSKHQISKDRIMWALQKIGKPILPYLKNEIADTLNGYNKCVALLVGRVGTNDSTLIKNAGEILVDIISTKEDPSHLDDAIRGIGHLKYYKGLSSIFQILLDENIVDRNPNSIVDLPNIPNRASIWTLNEFGLYVDLRYISRDQKTYMVIEFDDLEGRHHKVKKLERF